MPVVRTHLFGWQPTADSGGEGAAGLCHRMPSDSCPLGQFVPPPPSYATLCETSSATSSPSSVSSAAPSDRHSNRRAQRNLVRDPSWVPRPRNAFIIFRCQYSREHAKKGSDDRAPAQTAKSISKGASEAWKQLSPSEVDHFKELAVQERDEHARKNPNYRFRPAKRPTRSRHYSRTSGGLRHSPEVALGVIRGSDRPRHPTPTRDQDTFMSPEIERPQSPPATVVDQSTRTRFSSAPLIGIQAGQSPPRFPGEIRRTRSAAGRLGPMTTPSWDDYYNFVSQTGLPMYSDEASIPPPNPLITYLSDDFSLGQNIHQTSEPLFTDCELPSYEPQPDTAPISPHALNYSPTLSPTSSLIDWNFDAASTSSAELPAMDLLSSYGSQGPSEVSEQISAYAQCFQTWERGMTDPAIQNQGDLSYMQTLGPCTDLEQAQALQVYRTGLNDVGFEAEAPMFNGADASTFDWGQLFAQ